MKSLYKEGVTAKKQTRKVLMHQFGRALAHPASSRMINPLRENKSFRNTGMCSVLKMGVFSVHAHIRILREADLVYAEYYHITLLPETINYIRIS